MVKQFGADADVLAIAKSLIATKGKLDGSRRVPEAGASSEEMSSFYNHLGRPASASEYQLPESSDTLKPVIEKLRDVAYDKGLSQDQFAALATQAGAVSAEADTQLQAARTAWEAKIKEQYGGKAEEKIQVAQSELQKLMADDPQSAEVFKRFGLDKHPAIVNAMLERNTAVSDDTTPGVGASPEQEAHGPSAVDLFKEGMEVMRSEAYKGGMRHPENRLAQARITEIVAHLHVMGYDGFKDPRFRASPTVTLPDGTRIIG